MKLFRTTKGFIFSFGFNMQERKPDLNYVGWCDPEIFSWDVTSYNQAGWIHLPFAFSPEFVLEHAGTIHAYRPGLMLVFNYLGPPLVWDYALFIPDQWDAVQAA